MNHRIFERKWRSWVLPGACLSECRISYIAPGGAALRRHGRTVYRAVSLEGKRDPRGSGRSPADTIAEAKSCFALRVPVRLAVPGSVGGGERRRLLTSDQARLPAEFKHINKRRKRN